MAIDLKEPRRTAIIPVVKHGETYSISVNTAMWNEIQVLLLEGAITKKLTLEFKIEDLKANDAE